MTTATAIKTKADKSTSIKFTALSPLTTQLLRARTELQQRMGNVKVGRTIFEFRGEERDLVALLDYLIMDEIPGAGANSKEVKRLREVRRFLRAAMTPTTSDEQRDDAAHVTITRADDTREHILDLLNVLWEQGCDTPAGSELTDLANASNLQVGFDYRRWLSEVL